MQAFKYFYIFLYLKWCILLFVIFLLEHQSSFQTETIWELISSIWIGVEFWLYKTYEPISIFDFFFYIVGKHHPLKGSTK